VLGLFVIGCARVGEPALLLDADPSRSGANGEDGPLAVAAVDLRVPARVTGAVEVRVVYPADRELDPSVEDAPLVVVVQGGRVVPERYDWLAVHLASRGAAVALPRATLDLALFEPGDVQVAVDAVRDASDLDGALPKLVGARTPVAVAGHSLGGVVAAREWLRDPSIAGLVLLASYPAASDPVEDDARPVLALCGSEDGLVDLGELPSLIDRFGGPHWLGIVDGMIHFSWTDDPSDGELGRDGHGYGQLAEQRGDAQRVIDEYLDAVFDGDVPALGLPTPGITWSP
jgi:pimeloyl-ACP methyl ester carboxylesterase